MPLPTPASRALDTGTAWFLEHTGEAILAATRSNEGAALVERSAPPGHMAPLHVHDEDETYRVMDGELTFFIGEDSVAAVEGDVVVAPAGVARTFRTGPAGASWLVLTRVRSLARFEDFGRAVEPAGLRRACGGLGRDARGLRRGGHRRGQRHPPAGPPGGPAALLAGFARRAPGQKRELPAEEQPDRVQLVAVEAPCPAERADRAVQRRLDRPPAAREAAHAQAAVDDQRERVDPRPHLDQRQPRVARAAAPGRRACSSRSRASGTARAARSSRRAARPGAARARPRAAAAPARARARAPACSRRRRTLAVGGRDVQRRRTTGTPRRRARARATSGERSMSTPTHSTAGFTLRNWSTESPAPAAEVDHAAAGLRERRGM